VQDAKESTDVVGFALTYYDSSRMDKVYRSLSMIVEKATKVATLEYIDGSKIPSSCC